MVNDFQGSPELARLIESARESRGMSRMDLANETGMSYNMVAKIELARRKIPAEWVPKFANVLGISADRIYAASGDLPPDIAGRVKSATTEQIEAVRQIMVA